MSIFKKSLFTLIMSALAMTLMFSVPAKAESNPFADQTFMQVDTPDGHKKVSVAKVNAVKAKPKVSVAKAMREGKAKGKCGEGKCGEGKAKGKCGEGKCGEGKAKGKCGEGKCGEGKAKGKGKCGEGKCGE